MTLDDFRWIYFWEWLRRLAGRVLGLAFAVPFLVSLKRGLLRGITTLLAGLVALGALQGLLGWFMVLSGLVYRLDVSHLRLAAHFVLAAILLAALVTQGLSLRNEGRSVMFRYGT